MAGGAGDRDDPGSSLKPGAGKTAGACALGLSTSTLIFLLWPRPVCLSVNALVATHPFVTARTKSAIGLTHTHHTRAWTLSTYTPWSNAR